MRLLPESPVDKALKAGPRGDGKWEGYDYVYDRIKEGCHAMAQEIYVRCGHDHIESMADLGSGHEERMKYRLAWMRIYGRVK